MEYAALAECASSHPISKSLQKAYGKEIDEQSPQTYRRSADMGYLHTVDGQEVAAGNKQLMERLHVKYRECHKVGTDHPHGGQQENMQDIL